MDYMTLKEAAEKWGVTPRRVNYYCAGGRISGAVKMAGVWLIPKTAEKPIDGRTKQGFFFSPMPLPAETTRSACGMGVSIGMPTEKS